jgi:undecaprenyl-diphosphatase
MEALNSFDQHLFLFLNGLHCPFFDCLMYHGTNPLTWIPLYLVILWITCSKYRWKAVWVILLVALMFLVSDQLANFCKEMTCRLRPTHDPALTGVHTVRGYLGGQFGFYSAHASGNLALAVFLIMILGKPFPGFSWLMLFYAFFMAYTRIYLGIHYPGDIIAGWVAGGLIGWGFGRLCQRFLSKGVPA